jgi:TonB family protein
MDIREQYAYLRPQPMVWVSILGSAAAHAGLIILLIIGGLVKDSGGREHVKITALLKKGTPRPKDWLPRKEAATAPAPPKNVRPAKDAKKVDSNARKASSRVDYSRDMASALSGLAKEGGKEDSGEGSPDGVDEGTALIAQKGNEYMTKLYSAVKGQYSVPEIITERERQFLNATVVITINARGQIKNLTFEKRSGNQVFDSAIENAIRRAAPFPPPPAELADKYASEGIGIDFDARRM